MQNMHHKNIIQEYNVIRVRFEKNISVFYGYVPAGYKYCEPKKKMPYKNKE